MPVSNIINYKNWQKSPEKNFRSQRGDPSNSSGNNLKKFVLRGLAILLFLYLIYFFFFSQYFALNEININVQNNEFNTTELLLNINKSLDNKLLLVFSRRNYFFFSNDYLQGELNKKYLIEELTIEKKPFHTLNINLKEKVANLVYLTGDQAYLIDLNGKILSLINDKIIIDEKKLIKIKDESNTEKKINDNILSPGLVGFIVNLNNNFSSYIKSLNIASFAITSPEATFIKVITIEGPEIHLTDRQGLEDQLNKLKASLESEMINLKNVQYINLRIKDQVIYK